MAGILNRTERRNLDKKLKRELTPEQYNDLKSDSVKAMVNMEVERQVKDIMGIFMIVMRKNRISEERLHKILDDFGDEVNSKYGKRVES